MKTPSLLFEASDQNEKNTDDTNNTIDPAVAKILGISSDLTKDEAEKVIARNQRAHTLALYGLSADATEEDLANARDQLRKDQIIPKGFINSEVDGKAFNLTHDEKGVPNPEFRIAYKQILEQME